MHTTDAARQDGDERSRAIPTRIAAGDRDAERQFVAHYERGVRVLVRRYARPNDPAIDDLVQDVLSNVIERLRAAALDDPEALPAYVRQAAAFTVRAHYRSAHARSPHDGEHLDELVDPDDPSRVSERERLSKTVAALLEALPVARDRELLKRFYLREESKEEVCGALAIDEAHFRRVIFRARDRLKRVLVEAGVGEEG